MFGGMIGECDSFFVWYKMCGEVRVQSVSFVCFIICVVKCRDRLSDLCVVYDVWWSEISE